jgi:hypothetical protein
MKLYKSKTWKKFAYEVTHLNKGLEAWTKRLNVKRAEQGGDLRISFGIRNACL